MKALVVGGPSGQVARELAALDGRLEELQLDVPGGEEAIAQAEMLREQAHGARSAAEGGETLLFDRAFQGGFPDDGTVGREEAEAGALEAFGSLGAVPKRILLPVKLGVQTALQFGS